MKHTFTAREFALTSFEILCILGSTVLFFLWLALRKKISNDKKDSGLLLFSYILISWAVSCYLDLADTNLSARSNQDKFNYLLLSTFNNGFLLSSLPYFDNVFSRFRKFYASFTDRKKWLSQILFLSISVAVMFLILYSIGEHNFKNDNCIDIALWINFGYSSAILCFLMYAISFSISRRGYGKAFEFIGVIMMTGLIVSEYYFDINPPWPDRDDLQRLIIFIFYTGVVILLLISAFTWTIDYELYSKDISFTGLVTENEKKNSMMEGLLTTSEKSVLALNVEIEELKKEIERLRSQMKPQDVQSLIQLLSIRELEVLTKVEKADYKIALELKIDQSTVVAHRRSITLKLHLKSKQDQVVFLQKNKPIIEKQIALLKDSAKSKSTL